MQKNKADNAELTTEEARTLLRDAGLRCTAGRIAVLQLVTAASSPQSHAEVTDVLVPQGFDKSTIYRCLVELAESAILNRLELGDHVWRFEMRQSKHAHGEDHPHFVCVDCGKVECLPDVNVKMKPTKTKNSIVGNITEILLKGHCSECG